MSKTDDPLSPLFEWRLRRALDRVVVPASSPRYRAARARPLVRLRLAPVALAIALTGVLSFTAFAATGSANPVVWTQRAASTIESVNRIPETLPVASPTPSVGQPPAAAAAPSPKHNPEPESTARPEPSDSPEHEASPRPSQSPEPHDDHSGGGYPSGSPSPHDG